MLRDRFRSICFLACLAFLVSGCPIGSSKSKTDTAREGKTVMFVGMDISGSFINSRYFKDSIRFLSHYLYYHLNGLGQAEVPKALFVGSIGGAKPEEPKTFFPIQNFENRSIAQIEAELFKIFPRNKVNPFTDYTAFFNQIAVTVRNRNLVLKPIEIIMLSDGVPDAPKRDGKHDYRSINLNDLENLARRITLRVLYTSAVVGMNWQTEVPRQKVRVWTQDANVMTSWNNKHIFVPGKKFEEQNLFFRWIEENVDFRVKPRIVK